jgi:predicted unusual protein kinase regulating ubiquinone biosynthesis (AarF/ABC1/UbiB family)
MYDFGQACSLQAEQADGILDVIEAIVDMDSDRCVSAFAKMGVLKKDADIAKVRAKVQDNFETGKVQVSRSKLKKAGYISKDVVSAKTELEVSAVNSTIAKVSDAEVMNFFTLPAEYAFVARAISQLDGVGKALDREFDFISSAAPHIVEIKGATTYLSDEVAKWIRSRSRMVTDWQQGLGRSGTAKGVS